MRRYLPLLIITVLFLVCRTLSCVVEGFPVNSAPLAALFICSMYYLGRKGLVLSILLWALSYPLLSLLQGYGVGADLLTSIVGFGAVVGIGFSLTQDQLKGRSFFTLVGGSLSAALAFYLLTNTISWLGMPIYSKDLTGFVQSQWSGHPSFSLPSWVFLRNSLVANGGFALAIWAAQLKLVARGVWANQTA